MVININRIPEVVVNILDTPFLQEFSKSKRYRHFGVNTRLDPLKIINSR